MPRDRHLLVDAFNVIHAWPDLRATLTNHGPAAARSQLADLLRPIHDTEGWRVTLAFDGGTTDDFQVERPGTELTFSFVSGPKGLTADGVIEQLVQNANLPKDLDRRRISPPSAAPSPVKHKKTKSARRNSLGDHESKLRRADDAPEIIVATRDHMLAESTTASGATHITPEALRDWATRAAAQQTRQLTTHLRRSDSDWKTAKVWDKLSNLPPS